MAELILSLQPSRNGYAAEFASILLKSADKTIDLAYGLDLNDLRDVVKAEGHCFVLVVRLDG